MIKHTLHSLQALLFSCRTGCGPICLILYWSILYQVLNFSQLNAQYQDLKFDYLSLEHGLSQSTITQIVQDSVGYLWFGTLDGLNRYDGYHFTVFRNIPNDSLSLADKWITALYVDRKGTLWVGTLGGVLHKYFPENNQFKRYFIAPSTDLQEYFKKAITKLPLIYSFLNLNTIKAIHEDIHGTLWVATFCSGLYQFDRQKEIFTPFYYPEMSASGHIYNIMTLCETSQSQISQLWIGTFGGGLIKLEDNKVVNHFQNYKSNSDRFNLEQIIRLYPDTACSTPQLWIGTLGDGLFNMDLKSEELLHYKHIPQKINTPASNKILSLLVDDCQHLWIGYYGDGLDCFDPINNKFLHYRASPYNPYTPGSNEIFSLFKDRSGIVWIGTNMGYGINRVLIREKSFKHIYYDPTYPNSIHGNSVFSFYEDKKRIFWIGTFEGGLNRYDPQKNEFQYFSHDPSNPNSLSDNQVSSIFEDSEGIFWIGTYLRGLNRFDPVTKQFTHFFHDATDNNSIGGDQIRTVWEHADGTLWIASFGGGLNAFNRKTGKFTRFQHKTDDPYSLNDDRVSIICADISKNCLWIGTFDGGLNQFDLNTKKFIYFTNDPANPNSIRSNNIFTICLDPRDKNIIWIGTDGGGLNRFDSRTKAFRPYTTKDGLPNDVIYGIIPDDAGNLWMSTNRGISKFNQETETFTNYDLSDGLQSYEYNEGAYYKSRSGKIYFGGINGFNSFYAHEIEINLHLPKIVITTFKVFDQDMSHLVGASTEQTTLRLSYTQNFFTFGFSALDYTKVNKNQYAYKLEGLDPNWIYCGTRNEASYTNLSPGKYIFRVMGSNSDGVWNETGTFIKLRIVPPFWQETWFYMLFVSLVIGGIFTFYRYRIKIAIKRTIEVERIRSTENERVRKIVAADFHDELGQKLTRIALFSELLKQKIISNTPDNSQYIDKINRLAKELSSSTRDLIWTLDPQQDTLYDIAIYLKDFGDDIFDKTGVNFRVIFSAASLKTIKLPVNWRRHITLIFKEAMHNALKHSACQNVSFKITIQERNLEITLEDDGIGCHIKNHAHGHGLQNMKNRAQTITCEIDIFSTPGKGTIVRFSGKINPNGSLNLNSNYINL